MITSKARLQARRLGTTLDRFDHMKTPGMLGEGFRNSLFGRSADLEKWELPIDGVQAHLWSTRSVPNARRELLATADKLGILEKIFGSLR